VSRDERARRAAGLTVDQNTALALLREGEIEILGVMPDASNYTFAARLTRGITAVNIIWKPRDGEVPLWDFPEGTLYAREVAAFVVSDALGWDLVPPTVARTGPHGIGAAQLYVDHEPTEHYLTLMPARADDFRRMCALDIVVNNADRKSGHCLLERGTGHIWGVDHGVCFHEDEKLRTVIWHFESEPIPDHVRTDLERFAAELDARGEVVTRLEPLLLKDEIEAMRARTRALLATGVFPEPPQDRRPYPWPAI